LSIAQLYLRHQFLNNSTVSIVIPTKDSGQTIEKCLKSIKQQTYNNVEIIIVDCFSKDNTQKIASLFGADIIKANAKRSEARNKGAEKARGEFLLFVDSDMELNSNVIAECVQKMRVGYDALIIPEISVGQGFWVKCRALEKMCYVGDDLVEAARFFKKSVFVSIGGYDVSLEAGEDWDINERVRLKHFNVGRVNSFIAHEEGKLSLAATMRKKYKYGLTLDLYRLKQPCKSNQQIGLSRITILKSPRLIQDPVHAFGMIILKICETVALFTGFLEAKARRVTT
jgi:glycosyltransferase involved in cell wall biosynthesis